MIGRLIAAWFRRTPPAVTPANADKVTRHGPAVLIDVRESREWRAGHAPQARHLPLGQLGSRLAELPRDRQIITVCRSGRRSAVAAQQLASRGYQVANLVGGMAAWSASGLPVVTTGKRAGQIL
ncbi:MAG: Rhodanese domain protein [Friedmanniella sp.]|nr:Rhodanese domain protein [Friedmanniella sp.]